MTLEPLLARDTQQIGQGIFTPAFLPNLGLGAASLLSLLYSELPVCQALNCPQNSQCSAAAPTCRCLPGYTQQGSKCEGMSMT